MVFNEYSPFFRDRDGEGWRYWRGFWLTAGILALISGIISTISILAEFGFDWKLLTGIYFREISTMFSTYPLYSTISVMTSPLAQILAGVIMIREAYKFYIQSGGDESKWPYGFEVQVVGTIDASSEEDARRKLVDDLDIDNDGHVDHLKLESLEGGETE